MDRLDRMLALTRNHIPGARFANKADSALMRSVAKVVRPFNAEFSTRYVTVMGDTVWLPRPVEEWNRDDLAGILGHELVHMLDQKRYGLAFYASYGFPPMGRTTRAHWERRAYAVDLLIARERGGVGWGGGSGNAIPSFIRAATATETVAKLQARRSIAFSNAPVRPRAASLIRISVMSSPERSACSRRTVPCGAT